MKTKRFFHITTTSFVICALFLSLTGCVKKPNIPSDPIIDKDEYFDFSINQNIDLSIDYCFPNNDYVVLFDIYDQDPLTVDSKGNQIKKSIEPIYRAATNSSGKCSATISILSSLSSVWLYSEYAGVMSPIELKITDKKIIFNQNDYISSKKTKATTSNNHTYPDGVLTLGNWDNNGTPEYLLEERQLPKASILYNINEIFVKFKNTPLIDRYPEFFNPKYESNIDIIKPTKIYLTFINTTAAWLNTVGYYVYPTGQEPQSSSEVKRTLAFPSTTSFSRQYTLPGGVISHGALVGGDRILLQYWDGTKYVDEFPAGVSIGWWLDGNSFSANNGNIKPPIDQTRYSSDHLNKDKQRRVVALCDSKDGKIVSIAFEDNLDMKYNDATFFLKTDTEGAIAPNLPVMPEEGTPPTSDENFVTSHGTLIFEDLWPYTGDYDMNDIMINYTTTIYKQIISNAIYKIVTEYKPYHSGGKLTSGFGINFPLINNSDINKVKVTGDVTSKFMEGQSLEPGQKHPTIILFDDIHSVIGKTFSVSLELNDIKETAVLPPFNPFIVVESNIKREKEVHLVKYRPTDKVNFSLFGIGDDKSVPSADLFYVTSKNDKQYPFALNMSINDFPVPTEGISIDVTYPKFRDWVESNGEKNKDWYKFPAGK